MDHILLKKYMGWIATHGVDKYTPGVVRFEEALDFPTFKSGYDIIEFVLKNALTSTQQITEIEFPSAQDQLFDFLLTLLEELNVYKSELQIIFNKEKISLHHLKLLPILNTIIAVIFKQHIHTFLDQLSYNAIFINVFNNWLNDSTPDLSATSHKINHVCSLIFNVD